MAPNAAGGHHQIGRHRAAALVGGSPLRRRRPTPEERRLASQNRGGQCAGGNSPALSWGVLTAVWAVDLLDACAKLSTLRTSPHRRFLQFL